MPFPPKHSETLVYANRLDLDKLPVFLERSGTDPMFLEVTGLPEKLTYGKHYAAVAFKDPSDSPYYLRNGSNLSFEVFKGETHNRTTMLPLKKTFMFYCQTGLCIDPF